MAHEALVELGDGGAAVDGTEAEEAIVVDDAGVERLGVGQAEAQLALQAGLKVGEEVQTV